MTRFTPVEVVLAVRPINDLEEALPVPPVLDPELLLCAVAKFVAAGRPPQGVNHPQVLLWNELDLQAHHAGHTWT
jgi:hypothetical protein